MDEKQEFLKKLHIVKHHVEVEKSLISIGKSNKIMEILTLILEEMDKMEENMSRDRFWPFYPRGLYDRLEFFDSNNQFDVLAKELIEVARVYSTL